MWNQISEIIDLEQSQKDLEEEIELLHSDLEKQKSGHLTSTQSSSSTVHLQLFYL